MSSATFSPCHRGSLGDTAPPPLRSTILGKKIIELEQTPLCRFIFVCFDRRCNISSNSSSSSRRSITDSTREINPSTKTSTYEPPHVCNNTLLTWKFFRRTKSSSIRLRSGSARNFYVVLPSRVRAIFTCGRAARGSTRSAADRAVAGPGSATGLGPVAVGPAAGALAAASNLHQQAEQTRAAASGRPTARPSIAAAAVAPGNGPSPSAPRTPCPSRRQRLRRRQPRDPIADAAPDDDDDDDDDPLLTLPLADRAGRPEPEAHATTACQSRSRLRRPNRRRQWGG